MSLTTHTDAPAITNKSIIESHEWRDPISLNFALTPETPYPINALPTVLRKAVSTYQQYGQQPLALIASSAIANISLACQSLANVARDRYLVSPVSLYFLTAGVSGERKSAVDSVFSKASKIWEKEIRKKREPDVTAARALHHAWEMEKEALLTQIKRAMVVGEDSEYLKDLLAMLVKEEPEIPLQPMLYFEDATQEALAADLASGWPSAALWSDEAGIVLGSHSMQGNPMRFVAFLNRLWDGKVFSAHRKTSENFTLEDRRLTLNLMMQPILLQKLANQVTGISRQSGFLARCLIAYPQSAMGNRFYKDPPASLDFLADYEKRIKSCLNQSQQLTRAGCHKLPILSFDSDAKQKWVIFFNSVETGLKPQGQWAEIHDFASKAAENAARLAALFHLFDGCSGKISLEHTEQAIELIHWHLQEARRLLAPTRISTQHEDAQKLIKWILSKNIQETTPRSIQQSSPFRIKEQRDNAIAILIEHHWIRKTIKNKQTIIEVNPKAYLDLN
jgi:hypothetical protein